jgi:hypothetical protein
MKAFDDTPRTPTPDHVGGAAPAASDTRGGRSPRSEREDGVAEAHGAEQNRLLAALPLDEYARLLPRLTPVRPHVRDGLVEADVPIRDVWFVRRGDCTVESAGVELEHHVGEVAGTERREGRPMRERLRRDRPVARLPARPATRPVPRPARPPGAARGAACAR